MKILVVGALELRILRPFDRIVENRAVTSLHGLVVTERPRKNANIAVDICRLIRMCGLSSCSSI